jgi:hypothetical protein
MFAGHMMWSEVMYTFRALFVASSSINASCRCSEPSLLLKLLDEGSILPTPLAYMVDEFCQPACLT